ncbi:hypothetical protein CYMTET_10732 [Cymbomonas tetramitiformis]|uniref:Chitinase n=1 Tax=Cymbomonas tetramitiformis TaxID=36881 RepID=A0AAE0GQ43_9CHLO|nr:hypothetical protein CYMTET_10732 [Cymbomonas tetramitiformis]
MCMVLFPSGALRSGLSVVPAHRLYSIWALACLLTSAQGHGFMNIPRSRNAVAADEGRWWCSNNYCDNCPETEGKCPWPESCPQCLNRGGTVGLCGVVEGRDYLETKDMNGDPYQPQLQATYMQGGLLELEFLITAHHMGHVELHVCPNRDNPTQSCFDEHPLTFVEDLACAEPAPRDPNYPERGYLCPNNGDAEIPEGSYGDSRSGMGFRHHWRLPEGLHCEQCLLQWYYLTANSCNPPGYHDYPFPSSSWWKSALGDCSEIPGDGDGTPEQFWNCADIAITADGEPAPSSGPTSPPPPTSSPMASPPPAGFPFQSPYPPSAPRPSPGAVSCEGQPDGVHQNIADLTCKTFYNCATGAGGLVTCPEGLLFSAPAGACDWPANVQCNISSPPGSEASFAPTWSPPQPLPAPAPQPSGNSCAGLPDGTHLNTADATCTTFYICAGGVGGLVECSSGLVFNVAVGVCDWPSNVNCDFSSPTPRSIPPPSSSPESSSPPPSGTPGAMPPPRTPAPLRSNSSAEHVNVCYYTNWAQYRSGEYKYTVDSVREAAHMCTHINYAFGKVVAGTYELTHVEWNDESDPGPCHSQDGQMAASHGSHASPSWCSKESTKWIFSDMVASVESRSAFIRSAAEYLRKWGFDGLDLDWEYPAAEGRGGRLEDKNNFVHLLSEAMAYFEEEAARSGRDRLLLTMAAGIGPSTADTAYAVDRIYEHLDWINLMTYDTHGAWESRAEHHSATHAPAANVSSTSFLSCEWAVNYWLQRGCPADKLVLGMPFYGRSFTLESSSDAFYGAAVTGAGRPGPGTGEGGFLAFYEVAHAVEAYSGERLWDSKMQVPYAHWRDQWVGYDDQQSIRSKVRLLRGKELRGAMVWALDLDDFNAGYPLLRAVHEALHAPPQAELVVVRLVARLDNRTSSNGTAWLQRFLSEYTAQVAASAGVDSENVHVVNASADAITTEVSYTMSTVHKAEAFAEAGMNFSTSFTETYGFVRIIALEVLGGGAQWGSPPPLQPPPPPEEESGSSDSRPFEDPIVVGGITSVLVVVVVITLMIACYFKLNIKGSALPKTEAVELNKVPSIRRRYSRVDEDPESVRQAATPETSEEGTLRFQHVNPLTAGAAIEGSVHIAST